VITPNHHEAEAALGVEDINGDFALKEPRFAGPPKT